MCAEDFSNLLVQAEHPRLIHGIHFGKDTIISHLLFANDRLIFNKAAVEDCKDLGLECWIGLN